MPGRAKLFDIKSQQNRAVHQALKEAIEAAGRDVDGVVIILSRKNGKKTETFSAGALDDYSKAAFEGLKLQLNMIAHHLKLEQ